MSSNPLANLEIDYWYKALLVMATSFLILSLSVEMKDVENGVVQLISIGFIFIGLGEWINHPLQEKVGFGFKLSGYPRRNTLGGNLADVLGVVFIVMGIVRFFYV